MRQYGFAWPERMDCNDLPVYGDQEHLCMDSKEGNVLNTNKKTKTKYSTSIASIDKLY